MQLNKAFFGLLTTYSFWSLAGVTASLAYFGPPGVLVQALFMAIAISIFCGVRGIKLSFEESKITIKYSILRALTLGMLYFSFLHVKVGIVETIVACYVFILVCVFAPLKGETFNKKVSIPLCVSITGVCLATGLFPNPGAFKISTVLPMITMVLAATSFVYFRECALKLKPVKHLTYMHCWSSIFSVPVVLFFASVGAIEATFIPSWSQFFILVLASLFGLSGDYIYAAVQKHSSLTLNGLLAPSGVLFSCLFGYILKDESLTFAQISGVALVIFSVGYVNYIINHRKKEPIQQPKVLLEAA